MKEIMHKNNQLRRQRLQRNWRLSDIADQLGTTVTTVQRWERGSQQPSLYYRSKLCELFELSSQELGFGQEGDEVSSDTIPSEVTPEAMENLVLWTIPYARNPHFTGRHEVLDSLAQLIPLSKVAHSPLALVGLGGIGKTQIALEHAYRVHEHQPTAHILWITATSEETLLSSFTTIANALPKGTLRITDNDSQLVAAALHWLETTPQPWLLILDSADDLTLIQSYVPHHGNGNVLFTTRANALGSLALPLVIDNFSVEEGFRFLLQRTHRHIEDSPEEQRAVHQIVETLVSFPLALEQAGAYIEEMGCSFGAYLDLYQHHRQMLLARRGELSTHYPYSVVTTWSLSFQQLEQRNLAAAQLLQASAFLAPDRIPEELFLQGATHWPQVLQQATNDPLVFNQLFRDLLAFSFIKRFAAQQMISLHQLLQRVQRDRLAPEEQHEWAKRVVGVVHLIFPEAPENPVNWPRCQRYLEQAQACAALILEQHIQSTEAAELLVRLGIYLRERGWYTLAEAPYRQALAITEHLWGPNHAEVAKVLNAQASLFRQLGNYAEAVPLHQQALRMLEQELGPDHLEVAVVLDELAHLLYEQGLYEEIEMLLQRALNIREQRLGPDHPLVATILHNLGVLYTSQERYTEAEQLHQRALDIRKQRLGGEHPECIESLHNLGFLYSLQGFFEPAEKFYQEAFHKREQILGPEHPEVASSANNLANTFLAQGKYSEAESLLLRALHIGEQRRGVEHPQLVPMFTNLGIVYTRQERYTEAEPLYRQALYNLERLPESEGYVLATVLHHLAYCYVKQQNYTEAEPLYQRAQRILEQQREAGYYSLIFVLHGLALIRSKRGQSEEAAQLYQRAFNIYEKRSSKAGGSTAHFLYDFADFQQERGRLSEAYMLYSQAFQILEKLFGSKHPTTRAVRGCLHAVAVATERRGKTVCQNNKEEQSRVMRETTGNGLVSS